MFTNSWTDKGVVYTYNKILLNHNKEWNNAICSKMDGFRDYHIKTKEDKYHMISLICRI